MAWQQGGEDVKRAEAPLPSHLQQIDLHHLTSPWNNPRLHRLLPARAGRSFVMSLSGSWLKILFLVAVKSCANILWFTQTASKISLFFHPSAFWTNSRGIPKQSVGALRQESSSSLCVGLSTPPLLLCLWGFRPASAHVNLAKYREFDCNVSIAAPLVLLSRLSVGWMKAWLLGKQSLVSFPDESSSCSPYLSLLTLSEAECTRCLE